MAQAMLKNRRAVALALGIGAAITYQLNQAQARKSHPLAGIQHEHLTKLPTSSAASAIKDKIDVKRGMLDSSTIENPSAPEADLASSHDISDGTPVAEGLGVFHSKPDTDKIFTLAEVAKHNREGDIWVSYQGKVYDISEFVPSHPGGTKILLAAGKSLEPFWSMYRVHENPEVREILEEYRIGVVSPEECKDIPDVSNPFSTDPDRSDKKLSIRTQQPFNAEAPLDSLADYDITPSENFFVRNHLAVPDVKPELYELKVAGEGVSNKVFTLAELKSFPKYSVQATIQCAGNGRAAMDAVKPVRGLQWGYGAISNAEWSGARLVDVLESCNYKPSEKGKHAVFEGLDRDMTQSYGASIPIEKATDPRGDVILAYEMNGRDIPRDNGYPVRVVVPGVVGARNVKWLSSITIEESESESHWQQKDYKGFSPSSDWDHLDWSRSQSIQELPVISAICSPQKGDTLASGMVAEVKGYAYSGGGREIIRVDVSADGGKTWTVADLSEDKAGEGKHWAMRKWKANVQIPEDTRGKSIEFVCKAVDRSYNVQPEGFDAIYNARGVLCNAWHRVEVRCQ